MNILGYNKCFRQGNHTVRRSNRFWARIWTDLMIEQDMMPSIESHGGLTTGRGKRVFTCSGSTASSSVPVSMMQ